MPHVFINHDTNLLDVTLAPATTAAKAALTDDSSAAKQAKAATDAHGAQAPPSETLHTTTEHPFLTTDRGFVNAQDLQVGERVQQLDGSYGVVLAVVVTPGAAVRYNLTVQDLHTYAVGADRWVVHNCNLTPFLHTPHFDTDFASRAAGLSRNIINKILDEGIDLYDQGGLNNALGGNYGKALKVGGKWYTIWYDMTERELRSFPNEQTGSYAPYVANAGSRWLVSNTH